MSDKSEPLEELEVERRENTEESAPELEEPRTPWERIKMAFRQARRSSQSAKSSARRMCSRWIARSPSAP